MRKRFKDWVNAQAAKKLDKEPFSSLPVQFRLGIFLMALSFIVGYGFPLFFVILSVLQKKILTGVIGGTFFYLLSWGIFAVGIALAGKESLKYPPYFFSKFAKLFFPKYFRKIPVRRKRR